MNKLTIPSILVATVMVAGIFAFMPVEQASTVHDTIQATSVQIQTVDSTPAAFAISDADVLEITSTDAYSLIAITCTIADTNNSISALAAPAITVDGEAGTAGLAQGDPGTSLTYKAIADGAIYVSEGGADSIVFDYGGITGENADESIDCIVAFLASGDDTITAAWRAVGE